MGRAPELLPLWPHSLLLSEQEVGQKGYEVRRLVSAPWIFLEDLPSDCRSCNLWVPSPLFREPQGKVLGVHTLYPPHITFHALGVLGPDTMNPFAVGTFKLLPHSSQPVEAWEGRGALPEVNGEVNKGK